MTLKGLHYDVRKSSNPQKAKFLKGFFKTGVGQYGEGDIFAGLTVRESRIIAKKYKDLPLPLVEELLKSKIHEERLISLIILVDQFLKGNEKNKKEIFGFYIKNAKLVNNWDLVDLSADKIVGNYLLKRDRKILYKMAKSTNVWEKRIAIVATYQLILNGEYEDTFKITEILINDPHDLIQKATGWMIREVGKRVSREILADFLKKHYKSMPRTMLRYSIEHFPIKVRRSYLLGSI